jgi:hypothetical protein
MLEQPALLLRPWSAPPLPLPTPELGEVARQAGWTHTRAILDAGTAAPLGLAARRPACGWPGLRWLFRRTVEVYETVDAALLCLLYVPWWGTRTWQVCDSDDRLVGRVRCGQVWDGLGNELGLLLLNGAGSGRFVAPSGAELATFTQRGADTLLTFGAELNGEPFAKMALLAALLIESE